MSDQVLYFLPLIQQFLEKKKKKTEQILNGHKCKKQYGTGKYNMLDMITEQKWIQRRFEGAEGCGDVDRTPL